MSSLVALRPGEIQATLPVARASPIVAKMQGSTPQLMNAEASVRDSLEGKESREKSDHEQDAEGDLELKNGGSSNEDESGPHRKRRRSRKGLDKKFECPTPNCGKSYSRAEHL